MSQASGYEAWIISIGNELLIGKVINTNLAWLGRKLTLLGYNVRRGLILSDDIEDIEWGFRTALGSNAKVIVSTGGLGPTFDDKTLEGVAAALDEKLVLNEKSLEEIRKKYERIGLSLNPARIKMARIPESGNPLYNPVGTAPGVYIIKSDKHIFVLPGVPKEMKAIFETQVEKILKEIGPKIFFIEKTFTSIGIPESELALFTNRLVREEPSVYIKSHPKCVESRGPIIEFHVTASSRNRREAEEKVERVVEKLMRYLIEKGAVIEE